MNLRTRIGNQRGMALPLVMATTVLTFILLTAVIAHTQRSQQSTDAGWKMFVAQTTAESGIARVQGHLFQNPSQTGPWITRLNGMTARTTVVKRDADGIHVRSVARGDGVQQTIGAVLDPDTLAIREWNR